MRKIIGGALILIGLILTAHYVLVSSAESSMVISNRCKRTADAENALALTLMSEKRSTYAGFGGICELGTRRVDVAKWLDESMEYDPKRDAILWTYDFEPTGLIRRGRDLLITGTTIKESKFFFSIVPISICKHVGKIVLETK